MIVVKRVAVCGWRTCRCWLVSLWLGNACLFLSISVQRAVIHTAVRYYNRRGATIPLAVNMLQNMELSLTPYTADDGGELTLSQKRSLMTPSHRSIFAALNDKARTRVLALAIQVCCTLCSRAFLCVYFSVYIFFVCSLL